jgi:hypothetical protein
MNPTELDNFKKLIFNPEQVLTKSDTNTKNFENDNTILNDTSFPNDEFPKGMADTLPISDEIVSNNFEECINTYSDIIKIKKEPYFSFIKNNLKTNFFSTDIEIDTLYKTKMREKLQLILNKTYYNKNEVLEEVVWIIDEYITESDYALSKQILMWLNEQYKKN